MANGRKTASGADAPGEHAIDEGERTGEADRLYDELDAEARALGYDGAGDPGFRMSLAPNLQRARRERRNPPPAIVNDEDDEE